MEVVTIVGGAVLAPLFQTLFDRLKSSDLVTYARERKVLEELNKWESMLKTISAVLDKVEEQEMTEVSVKSWFNDLRNLAYDMEDILDEFNTEAMRQKFHADSEARSSKVHKLLRSSVAGLSLNTRVKFSDSVVSKTKNISKRLGVMITQKDILKLSGNANARNSRMEERLTLPTTSLISEAQVHGREKDRRVILELIKCEASAGISVIPLVGMGGIGKTTLAQLVYNDASLQFDFKAWVSVGEDFSVPFITNTILQSAGDDEKQKDLNYLQVKLREKLSRLKCLVVLDDLWSQDYEKWTLFFGPFAEGAAGSRIIVTTRNQEVALMTSGRDGYPLKELSYEDCLSVFAQHALGRKDFNIHSHLKEVGEKIVERCGGLPLAAKALGGILRGKQNIRSWEEVLNSRIWEEKGIVFPALKLSYYHLPSILKRCFGYTAIFNKNYEFDKTQLVLLWMAEGFIQGMNDGYKCFDDLLARSFIQRSGKNASFFVMHDLINDLARSVSGNICFNLDEEMKVNKSCSEVRHSGFGCSEYDIARRFEIFHDMNHLRTFLPLQLTQRGCFLSHSVLEAIIPKLVRLRVLELPYHGIVELPTSIGKLKHLRYLSLVYSQIKILPETLSKLFNLQTLILAGCTKLLKLPEDFCSLVNLQCLNIEGTESLQEMPLGIGNLTKLHFLSKFIVGNIDGRGIEELQNIPNLHGKLHIAGLQNVKNIQDAERVKMREREGIVHLVYNWTNDFDDFRNERNEQEVLTALQPQKSIARLSIKSYGGTMFPSWLGDHAFKDMTFLKLSNCCKVSSLPPLGRLPSLKDLRIEGMSAVKEVGTEFYGEISSSYADVFPSLQTLLIENMKEWKQLSCYKIDVDKRNVFPKLKELTIKSCLKLIGNLPKELPALQQLHIDSCPMLEIVPGTLPSLGELVISRCKELVFKRLSNLECLTKLEISHISSLVSLDRSFLEGLVSVQEMNVEYCDEMKHLWEDRVNIERLKCLKQLKIRCCKELVSLAEGEDGILPPNLQVLNIENCAELEKLPNQLHTLTSLADLEVNECPKLVTFPTGGLPPSVKRVGVQNCDSLVSLVAGFMVGEDGNSNTRGTSHIDKICIRKYEALNISSTGGFPVFVRFTGITNGMLAQLFGSLQMQNRLSRLMVLTLWHCEELETFPDTGISIPTLFAFKLLQCRKLRCLPNHMQNLTSLQILYLVDCPEIESFPEGGLPPNLTELCISNCDKLERQPLSDWRLNAFTSLGVLIIKGGMQMVSSFPHDSLLLPTSLTTLSITGFRNLKSLSIGLQKAVSLQHLEIWCCPKLRSLPREGLPSSLEFLSIHKCPLLLKRCRKGKGDYWPLIAPIPYFYCES